MSDQPSFAVVATPGRSGREWVESVRRFEQTGFGAVLVPDTLWTPSPFPTLAAAAAVTESIRLRTWVLAAPLRSEQSVARESSALQLLSEGRFELGVGTGRPDAKDEAVRLGVPWPTADERITQLERVVGAVRDTVTPVPAVVMAVSGPKILRVAGRIADRIALAVAPTATRTELFEACDRTRAAAPDASLSLQIMGFGDDIAFFLRRQGLRASELIAADAAVVLGGSDEQMVATIQGYVDDLGIDEIVVPADLVDAAAGVMSLLKS